MRKFKKNRLKKINKRRISKKKDCLWNIYRQFGCDIYKNGFEDNFNSPLYKNCVWTEEQELEMIKEMKKRKTICHIKICHIKKTHRRKQAYNCHGCRLLFYFPTTIEKNEKQESFDQRES